MHIGFITSEYPCSRYKGNIGGIATFIRNLSIELISKGHKVSVFIHSQSKAEFFVEDNVSIYFVAKKILKGFTWISNRLSFNKYVNNIVKNNCIDLLEAPEWTGFTAFMKFNCPLILRLHGSDTYFCHLEKRKLKIKNKFFEKKALLGATKIVGVSKFVAKKTKELFKLNIDIDVIYNTIDTNKFKPNHQNIQLKSLLYFGTLVRKKGVLEIAKMFSKLADKDDEVKLVLLGKDNRDVFTEMSTLAMIKKILSEKALQRMLYIDAVPYDEVISYIQKADVVLLPSFAEAFPMTWLEAMAMEKKLVTSDIGWAKELMIDGQTGFTVNPKNHNDFADKVTSLFDDVTSIQMGVNARKRIKESFNSVVIFEKNINFYKKTINEF